ncbi:7131_t:CDS:2 [Acaulospora colombiana]|uniref:7131_t:CDS:1 n=1 Tax=Acaulospora colombiana TaxID=27376 RepID=A0ACA9LJN5_9GLOM|nr:7131_t:CDS:2 [Acaulospora colombiana]
MAIHRNIVQRNRYVKQKLNDWKKKDESLKTEQLLNKDTAGDNNKAQENIAKDWEIPRKALHSIIVIARNTLLVAFPIVLVADILRFNNASFNNLYIKVMGFLMRETEKRYKINGVVFYLAGCIGSLSLFPKDIAVMSILILSWCDTAASFFGRKYGQHTFKLRNGKSLAANLVIDERSWIPERSVLSLPLLVLLTGIIGGASELIDLWGLDDNLVLPLAAGSFLWMLLRGLGLGTGESMLY